MYQNAVIPARCAPPEPESRSLNRSCNSYGKPDFRFTMPPAGWPGMTKRGFTLIELLVVVLIIGILSAAALPQYKRAVQKAQMAQVFTYLAGLAKAQDVYYMSNGQYSTRMDELDWDFPCERHVLDDGGEPSDKCYFKFSSVGGAFKINRNGAMSALFFAGADGIARIHCYRGGLNNGGAAYFQQNPGVTTCVVSQQYPDGLALIKGLGGTLVKTHNWAGLCNGAPCLEFAM